MERDKRNTKLLESLGWLVIRIWEGDIKKKLKTIADNIERIVKEKRNGLSANALIRRTKQSSSQ
jgi:G:T-mismatch repair DNA endonuclease (very short patch repair protein)